MRLLIILALIVSCPVAAQVYKWTDENGVTHFGSQPPPGQQDEVKIRESAPGAMGANPGNQRSRSDFVIRNEQAELEERQRRAEEAERRYRERIAEIQEEIEARPDYVCQGIKDRLQLLYEDMEELKRQGYTISERRELERDIRREEMHRDNLCR